MKDRERAFWGGSAIIFLLFAGIIYFPVLFGKIPFPRDLVLQFPAWAGRIEQNAMRSYADIGDLITFFYPTRAFEAQSVKHGVLPLWNPLLLAGEPFLANAQSSLFYPLNILYYVLPLPTAWAGCMMLRMFLAALFMAMFVRSIGGSKGGAVFSGIVFASSGFMTAWQGQPMTDSGIWLPFVCVSVHRLHKNVSGTSMAIAAVGFAMPLLAGHPETAAHITLTGTALALMLWLFPTDPEKSPFNPRFVAGFTVVGVLALGLASVQMIPTLEWLKQIGETFNVWPSLTPREALGWVSRDIFRSPNSAGLAIPEAAAYMAMVSVVAAPLAVFHRPRLYATFLLIVAACAISIAYGFEPMNTLVSHIPVFRALKNFRMLVANFAIAGLSGLGISVLEERIAWTRRDRVAALALVASMFTFIFVLIRRLQLLTTFKAEVIHRPSFSRTLVIMSLILVAWKLFGGLRGRIFSIAVCSLAVFDLGTFAFGYTGFAGRDEIFPSSPAFDFLARSDKTQYRIIQVGLPYSSNAPVMYGLHSADGYEIGFTNRQGAFLKDLIDPNSNGINFLPDRIFQYNDRRLDLLDVKYVVLPAFAADVKRFSGSDRFSKAFNNGAVAIFENRTVLPRAWMVPASGIEIIPEADKEVDRIKSPAFDPLKSVTISEVSSLLPAGANETAAGFNGYANVVESGVNQLRIQTQASDASVLVVSQMYYPGWKAVVDGKQAQILHANVTLTGIPLLAGAHEVRLVFQPLSFWIGLGLTSTTMILLLAVVWSTRRSARQRTARNAVPAMVQ